MNNTPRKHFAEDITRAMGLLDHASDLENSGKDPELVRDIRLSAVAMAVGAMDAYFCDAYVDCLTRVLRAYVGGSWKGDLPAAYSKRELPAGVVLDNSRQRRPLWSIRMAARKVMERDDMLKLSRIDDHFNGVFPANQKPWLALIDNLASFRLKRLTKYSDTDFRNLSGQKLGQARRKATSTLKERIGAIVQMRHDWIHNCGRPKSAIKRLTDGEARERITDVCLFVSEFDDHLQTHRLA